MPTTDTPQLGFAHFISQTDSVGMTLLIILIVMSIASWAIIIGKALARRRTRRDEQAFRKQFERATSLDDLRGLTATEQASGGLQQILKEGLTAGDMSLKATAKGTLRHASGSGELLGRALEQALEDEVSRQESGQTVLASVASSAPFVGLLGTVWGIYNALLAIGASGDSSLTQVAGPVGEALVMTAIGLAVAIPAALGYNVFARQTRLRTTALESYANRIYQRLSTGA